MIKESLYFTFDNIPSSNFNILNVSVQSGLFEESFIANRNLIETTVRGKTKPYLSEVRRDPISFQLTFYFEEYWNDQLIDDICDWLDVDYYRPLAFESNLDRVFYAIPTESLSMVHNGLKQGYVTLTMRCDSPYCYSREIEKRFDFRLDDNLVNNFTLQNLGRLPMQPIVEIVKVGAGKVHITNLSKANSEFIMLDIADGETITIDCEKRYIESSMGLNKYDNFNQNYLSIPYGINHFQITGACALTFKYYYTYKAITL